MLEQKDLELIAEIMERKLQPVREDVNQVKEEINQVKEDVRRVETTLENETNRGIQIVAEGHVDLRRKLNETLRMKEDDELIRIRVNRLERELNELKREIR